MAALWENDAVTLAGMLRSRDVSAREVIAAHIGNQVCCTDCRPVSATWSACGPRQAGYPGGERISEFCTEFDVLACPVSQVPPFAVDLDWVHEIDGVPQETYLGTCAASRPHSRRPPDTPRPSPACQPDNPRLQN